MVCVVITIAEFLSFNPILRVFQRKRLAMGSTPVEGSSKN